MSESIPATPAPGGEFLFYQTDDGRTRLQVRVQDETVWLTQKLLSELFQKDVRTINEHIQNIFEEHELEADSVIRNFRITAADGKSYDTQHYNLDTIISVGYRVKSQRGTQFRIWATQRLREYIVKGFAMDDERLKRRGGGQYFEELLARIRRAGCCGPAHALGVITVRNELQHPARRMGLKWRNRRGDSRMAQPAPVSPPSAVRRAKPMVPQSAFRGWSAPDLHVSSPRGEGFQRRYARRSFPPPQVLRGSARFLRWDFRFSCLGRASQQTVGSANHRKFVAVSCLPPLPGRCLLCGNEQVAAGPRRQQAGDGGFDVNGRFLAGADSDLLPGGWRGFAATVPLSQNR